MALLITRVVLRAADAIEDAIGWCRRRVNLWLNRIEAGLFGRPEHARGAWRILAWADPEAEHWTVYVYRGDHRQAEGGGPSLSEAVKDARRALQRRRIWDRIRAHYQSDSQSWLM